jgi:adenosylcobyric acid synthase
MGEFMTAKTLMIQGTSSSAGKSLLVAALCRIYARRGVRVAPFKAQNMSNNAAVCPDGAEIGRAQAVQAMGARIEPTADMNPILLKPEADARSQVIVMGRPWRTLRAGRYYEHKRDLWSVVTAALDRLRDAYELVIIEGAGSPAEVNLKAGDIVNMAVARYAQAPVLLVGDIDRGGIFAQLLGTLWLLDPEELRLVKGLVVNKFRGDPALFADGIRILEERGGVPVAGMIPFLRDLGIPEEDAVAIENLKHQALNPEADSAMIDIAVIALPRIANFDDFDPLAAEPGVRVRYVSTRQTLGSPQAVILPGTKSTMADLKWLQAQGLVGAIQELAAAGRAVVGICGGYQMLGRSIRDPDHAESSDDVVPGLGLLAAETVFEREKATHRAQARLLGGPGWLADLAGQMVSGYEIHMGHTQGDSAWLEITERSGTPVNLPDGIVNRNGRIWGCYLHGLFENQALRQAWLSSLGWQAEKGQDQVIAGYEEGFERLADAVETALDMDYLEELIAS